jgi:hypothetical protein
LREQAVLPRRPLLPIRNRIRVLFRGSALGRKQLAGRAGTGPAADQG